MTTKTKPKTSKKKPSWSVVTFKQIEARRLELGHSKSSMAEALGVTNSTFHNWQRGTTVPHVNQQEQITETLAGIKPRAVNGTKAPAAKPSVTKKKRGRPKGSKTVTKAPKVTKARTKTPRTVRGTTGDVGGGTTQMRSTQTESHPFYPAETPTVRGIAQITSAWITAQGGKGPSAGSVYKFVNGLKDVL